MGGFAPPPPSSPSGAEVLEAPKAPKKIFDWAKARKKIWPNLSKGGGGSGGCPPCVTFRRVAVSLRGPGQSPVLPFACCVGLLRFAPPPPPSGAELSKGALGADALHDPTCPLAAAQCLVHMCLGGEGGAGGR